MSQGPVSLSRRPAKSLLRLFFAAHLFFPIAWLWSQVTANQPDQRDWYYLRLAGDRFLKRDWSSIYSSADGGFLWRYPPFALYLAALLALLDPRTAYWLLVIVAISGLAAALFFLYDALRPTDFGLVALAVATSAAFTSVLVTGQNSSLIALAIAAGLWALLRGNKTLPFVFFGFLVVKPNWIPVFALYALIQRRFRGFAIMAAMGVSVILAGLPLGVTDDFVSASLRNSELLTAFPAYKLITMRSFLGALTDSPVAWWSAVLMVLLACGIYVWRPASMTPLPRQIGVVVLITIAANLYVAFYDGLMIMIPAVIWWSARDTYSSKPVWRMIGLLIAFIWIWDQAVFFYAGAARSLGLVTAGTPSLSMVGPALTVWVLAEVFDIWIGHRSAPAADASP